MGNTYNTLWSTLGGAPCRGVKHHPWINGCNLFRSFYVNLYRLPICVISTGYHARLGINGLTGICDWGRKDWWNDPEDLRVHRTLPRKNSLQPSPTIRRAGSGSGADAVRCYLHAFAGLPTVTCSRLRRRVCLRPELRRRTSMHRVGCRRDR
jgi:hypothetical protein